MCLGKRAGWILQRPVFRTVFLVTLLAGVAVPGVAQAQDSTPHLLDKASNGNFTGIAIVTKDLVWYDMFQRPETPRFEAFDSLLPGEQAALATVFSNAESGEGRALIYCEITASEPDGSTQAVQSGNCYDGPYLGDNILHPTQLDLRIGIGPDDQFGLARFNVLMRDESSRREVELEVTFLQGVPQ